MWLPACLAQIGRDLVMLSPWTATLDELAIITGLSKDGVSAHTPQR